MIEPASQAMNWSWLGESNKVQFKLSFIVNDQYQINIEVGTWYLSAFKLKPGYQKCIHN